MDGGYHRLHAEERRLTEVDGSFHRDHRSDLRHKHWALALIIQIATAPAPHVPASSLRTLMLYIIFDENNDLA